MCGLAGILNLSPRSAILPDTLEAMIRALPHRGPDDTGYFQDADVGLAHARLGIIDLLGGKQPIHNEDKTIFVVCNGEIFNFIEMRRELEAEGHRFYTASDAEVIVHAYEQHGLDFLQRLNGQFALAIWDQRQRRLVLARDRVGIRPLFYTEADGRLLFASEIKALFQVPAVARELNPLAIAEVFTFWCPLPGSTLFERIVSVPPGHLLVADLAGGQRRLIRYWDWSFPTGPVEAERPIEACAEELRALLIDSVRLQLRSDVPVGAYLSGGLDSAVVAALIKSCTGNPPRTFSISFDDDEFDESPFQQELVRHLQARQSVVRCSRADIGEAFPRTIWHTEAPILRTAPTPLLLLSARVREEGYKVVLTGEGADEVLGGYDLFKEARIRRFWARRPDSRMRPALLKRLHTYLKASPTASPAYSRSFFGQGLEQVASVHFGHMLRWSTTRRTWRFFSRELRDQLQSWEPGAALARHLPPEIDGWPPLCRDQYIEARTLMSEYLLSSQGDRMAMANSVEGRFPFLDHRVIEFANRLPVRYKLMGLNEKYLLKKSMRDLLPTSILRRPKQPYRAPESQSFFRLGKPLDYVAELLGPERIKAAGWFDPVATASLFEKCRRGDAIGFADNTAFVGILSTMVLDDLFLRAPASTGSSLPGMLVAG
jgi:asparagine synthase (glutamine-hydrolysing)